MSTTKQKAIELDAETLEMWNDNTGREPFVTAWKSYKSHRKAGRECRIVWRSSRVIQVIPLAAEPPVKVEPAPVVAIRMRVRKS